MKTEYIELDENRIDPDVIRISRDILGNPVDGINNEAVTEALKTMGFRHKGYGYAYDGSWTNRYTLITDLSKPMEEVIKTFSKLTKSLAIKQHEHTSSCCFLSILPQFATRATLLTSHQVGRRHKRDAKDQRERSHHTFRIRESPHSPPANRQ